jgi:hypothetical protein
MLPVETELLNEIAKLSISLYLVVVFFATYTMNATTGIRPSAVSVLLGQDLSGSFAVPKQFGGLQFSLLKISLNEVAQGLRFRVQKESQGVIAKTR